MRGTKLFLKNIKTSYKAHFEEIQMLSWISFRLLFTKKALLNSATIWSLLGLILGVIALVVTMAVVSGYEKTLQSAMIDVTGHVQVVKRTIQNLPAEDFKAKLQEVTPDLKNATLFNFVEGVAAKEGQVYGVLLQGLETATFSEVLNIQKRIIQGEFNISTEGIHDDQLRGVIGKGLAKKLSLQVGDVFAVIIPIADGYDAGQFRRKMGRILVSGIIDLGKNDYNDRFIILDIDKTQKLAELGDHYQGAFLKYAEAELADDRVHQLAVQLGRGYYIRGWRDLHENLFEAVKLERIILFFVVFIISIVAAFNVSSTLFINVVKKYPEVALLKTLGLAQRQIKNIFIIQGLLLASTGLVIGFVSGLVLCYFLEFLQQHLQIISGDVYKLDSIQLYVRTLDVIFIIIATLLIAYFATRSPAKKGAELSPVEGFRNV